MKNDFSKTRNYNVVSTQELLEKQSIFLQSFQHLNYYFFSLREVRERENTEHCVET